MSFVWMFDPFAPKGPHTRETSVNLDNISVAAPCPASWEQMSGDDCVRHCAECNLNVYNLSELTKLEAERLIASREGRLCVRFFRRADGTVLTRNCPRGLRAATERISRIAATVLSAIMATTQVFAQSPAVRSQQQSETKNEQLGLDVTVVDPTNAVIPNAQIVVCRCKDKLSFNATTDASGAASFRTLPKGTYEVQVGAKGFKAISQNVTIKKIEQLQIKLAVAPRTETVVVQATPVELMGTMGMLITNENFNIPTSFSPGGPAPMLFRRRSQP